MALYSKKSVDMLPDGSDQFEKLVAPQAAPRKYKILYPNLISFGYIHIAAFYGLYLCFTSAKWATIIFSYVTCIIAEVGITAGAHRLWTHKTYKAKRPLEILLMLMNSLAFQNTAIDWVKKHRLHHKYSDTDGDPHNATRGFFYSHIGWLLVKSHPEVVKRTKFLEMSDVLSNPVLQFQKKYALLVIGAICFVLPTVIPMLCWCETLSNAWHICMLRYAISLHATFLVNSAAHMWGTKPYDETILPAENKFVSFIAVGEGFHNYHHVFPWDYRAAELGNNKLNFSTFFIDFFAWIGWAYDLKTVSPEMMQMRTKRTGNGKNIWVLDDEDMTHEIRAAVLEGKRN